MKCGECKYWDCSLFGGVLGVCYWSLSDELTTKETDKCFYKPSVFSKTNDKVEYCCMCNQPIGKNTGFIAIYGLKFCAICQGKLENIAKRIVSNLEARGNDPQRNS